MSLVKANNKLCSPKQLTQLGRAVVPLHQATCHASVLGYHAGLTAASPARKPRSGSSPRYFSTTSAAQLRDFFPAKETKYIRTTPPAWPHPGYTEEEMRSVVPAHRVTKTLGDKVAWTFVRVCKWGMDQATRLKPVKHDGTAASSTEKAVAKPGDKLTEAQWLVRCIFLESIAGVPGMVAGMLRHLNSLRRLKRDNGWIESLLEESYNERMHLLTFMKMCEPGWFMKTLLIGAQGVFFNALFVTYLISPKICHRFVGYLEEEAVHTYTQLLDEIDAGYLPKWSDKSFQVPDIAIQYWNLPEGKRTMYDLILYIRADEAGHRGTNHTLANLNQKEDPNPFLSVYKDTGHKPKAFAKPTGYEREDVIG